MTYKSFEKFAVFLIFLSICGLSLSKTALAFESNCSFGPEAGIQLADWEYNSYNSLSEDLQRQVSAYFYSFDRILTFVGLMAGAIVAAVWFFLHGKISEKVSKEVGVQAANLREGFNRELGVSVLRQAEQAVNSELGTIDERLDRIESILMTGRFEDSVKKDEHTELPTDETEQEGKLFEGQTDKKSD